MTGSEQERLDAAEIAALYVAHGDELRRFLTGVLRDAQLASDVLQTTFTRLVERGHETRPATRKAWLFRVAYHEALALRRRQSVGAKVLERAFWNGGRSVGTPDEALLRLEAVDAVRDVLRQLPLEQQQVVRMRIYEEKTFAAIADELGIPLGTALGRMRAAIVRLSQRLRGMRH